MRASVIFVITLAISLGLVSTHCGLGKLLGDLSLNTATGGLTEITAHWKIKSGEIKTIPITLLATRADSTWEECPHTHISRSFYSSKYQQWWLIPFSRDRGDGFPLSHSSSLGLSVPAQPSSVSPTRDLQVMAQEVDAGGERWREIYEASWERLAFPATHSFSPSLGFSPQCSPSPRPSFMPLSNLWCCPHIHPLIALD